jgi:hypothetical protein
MDPFSMTVAAHIWNLIEIKIVLPGAMVHAYISGYSGDRGRRIT